MSRLPVLVIDDSDQDLQVLPTASRAQSGFLTLVKAVDSLPELWKCREHSEQVVQGIDRQVDFGALRFLAPSNPAQCPLSGVLCKVRLSMMIALGSPFLDCSTRDSNRRSCAAF